MAEYEEHNAELLAGKAHERARGDALQASWLSNVGVLEKKANEIHNLKFKLEEEREQFSEAITSLERSSSHEVIRANANSW